MKNKQTKQITNEHVNERKKGWMRQRITQIKKTTRNKSNKNEIMKEGCKKITHEQINPQMKQ